MYEIHLLVIQVYETMNNFPNAILGLVLVYVELFLIKIVLNSWESFTLVVGRFYFFIEFF